MKLTCRWIPQHKAKRFIKDNHRHLKGLTGAIVCVGCWDEEGKLRGVAAIGRPVARLSDDGLTCEVTRCATDGCPNACSCLYGFARRVAQALNLIPITLTRNDECGVSLLAAGCGDPVECGGGEWDRPNRKRKPAVQPIRKKKWDLRRLKNDNQKEACKEPTVSHERGGVPDLPSRELQNHAPVQDVPL